MNFFQKKSWLWAVDKPEDIEFQKYIGRFVRIEDENHNERSIEIHELLGSLKYPTKFQVNTKVDGETKSYFISMLDFYGQMNGEDIPKEWIRDFDDAVFSVKQNPMKKQGGLWLPNKIKN